MKFAGVALMGLGGFALAGAYTPNPDWRSFDGRDATGRVTFKSWLDLATFDQNDQSRVQYGRLPTQFHVRRLSGAISGNIKFRNPWRYTLGFRYIAVDRGPGDSSNDEWSLDDAYVGIPWAGGYVYIGNQPEPFTLERVSSDSNMAALERTSWVEAFTVSRSVGVKAVFPAANRSSTLSLGFFNSWMNGNSSLPESDSSFLVRVTGVTNHGKVGNMAHAGLAVRFAQPTNGQSRYKAKPENHFAPSFVDTGAFAADYSWGFAPELAVQSGKLTFAAEGAVVKVEAPTVGSPTFSGYSGLATYSLTGEVRPYDAANGIFGKITPRRPVDAQGRGGGWETYVRYARTNLSDGSLQGGDMDRWTLGVNWYPATEWRVGVAAGLANVNQSGANARTGFLQARIQFDF